MAEDITITSVPCRRVLEAVVDRADQVLATLSLLEGGASRGAAHWLQVYLSTQIDNR